jgi:citrate lyase subunit beta/citryl-CoA lyase
MRRSWLFVAGADEAAHEAAARSGADVIVLELEDFTPPELRPKARALAGEAFTKWREAGALAAVRVNPLETCGRDDLRVVMLARPDVVALARRARCGRGTGSERRNRRRIAACLCNR